MTKAKDLAKQFANGAAVPAEKQGRPITRSKSIWNEIVSRLGWRVIAVFLAGVVATAVTIGLYFFGAPLDVSTHQGAVFASWVAGVAIFDLVGLVVAIVSLFPPELGSFDYRARVLFRGQSGPHIEYIIGRMGEFLEQYAETQTRKLIVSAYHEGESKFLTTMETTTVMRSYIDDGISTAGLPVAVLGCCEPPPGGEKPSLVYLRIDDDPIAGPVEFTRDLADDYSLTIGPGKESIVEQKTKYWVATENDPCSHSPVRYVKQLKLQIENHLGVNLHFTSKLHGRAEQTHVLRAGARLELPVLNNLRPRDEAYDIRFKPLEAAAG